MSKGRESFITCVRIQVPTRKQSASGLVAVQRLWLHRSASLPLNHFKSMQCQELIQASKPETVPENDLAMSQKRGLFLLKG